MVKLERIFYRDNAANLLFPIHPALICVMIFFDVDRKLSLFDYIVNKNDIVTRNPQNLIYVLNETFKLSRQKRKEIT